MIAKRYLSWVLVPVLLGSAAPAMAQQSRSRPYSNLFKPRDLKEAARLQQNTPATAQPPVVCGTTKVPANPQTDPKVARDPAITHFTMRVLPPGCR